MEAKLLLRERYLLSEFTFVELVIWKVPLPVRGSNHSFKYRLALIAEGLCVLRYDNEVGKGDHKHLKAKEFSYFFNSVEQLQSDFWSDVDSFLKNRILK